MRAFTRCDKCVAMGGREEGRWRGDGLGKEGYGLGSGGVRVKERRGRVSMIVRGGGPQWSVVNSDRCVNVCH